MQSSSKYLLGAAALLALILAAYLYFTRPEPSDRDQIAAQIEAARIAAIHHDVGGIMQIVSGSYNDAGGMNNDRIHLILIRTMKNAGPSTITISTPNVSVQGDSATSAFHLQVLSTVQSSPVFDRSVTMTWKREDGYKFLIVPTKVWRVVGADYGNYSFGD